MKLIIRWLAFTWAFGALACLMFFGLVKSPQSDSAKLLQVLINVGIGVIAALLAIASREPK